ncbi:MAG TPA: ectoine/hydroxyectoine ABC transporter substrate-binding protein EhuB [Humidesulfovibrio sp.]|uniref:ectoine/hydroxyectoine ABC transporter substrate-binding protein EhuB n=1 Tax=Humidesulfovibrio sp. TaxID=2910988 RepID=UPI002C83C45B|nr:ectoine/hydroxyectoine ABC transporter substrate-binding protein EhuB [Humidesulfovibrio sp.]HWR04094.1 ectoine/hydroxyectoine ABC transporter substrate-binding protein EhuB [Humidesulfovibrio sp.]
MSRARILLWIVLGALASAAALSLFMRAKDDHTLERIRTSGVIRIGYAVEAPYAFLTPEGVVTGQSPELARRVAHRLGIKDIEWRLADFGALIAELKDGRIDVIAAGMFITPERAEQVSFSEPVFHVRPALLVARGNPKRLHSYKDALADGTVRLAVLTGAVEGQALLRAGLPEVQLIQVPDAQTGRVAVETGLADGLALSSPTIKWMAIRDQLGRTEIARPFTGAGLDLEARSGFGGFGFRKEDKSLLAAWNGELRALAADPEFLDLMDDFGFGPEELPGNMTTREILAP